MASTEEHQNSLKRICVFCGSKAGNDSAFAEQAEAFAKEMARRSIDLVYGGGTIGIMGIVARRVAAEGRHVLGVIPRSLFEREVCGEMIGESIVTNDMHERKAKMAEAADCFVALPGGFGTYEELFEVITWQQLGIHNKPIGVLNVGGYYDPLVALIEHGVESGFIGEKYGKMVVVESDPALLLERLRTHRTPEGVIQWIKPDET